MLQKIKQDRAEGILIVPCWETQLWFPVLMRMCVAPPKKDSEQHKDIEVTESAVYDSLPSQQTPPSRLSCVRQLYEGRGLSEESVLIEGLLINTMVFI